MFKANYNKGFSMTFANGITISVQWGSMNYCSNRSFAKPIKWQHDMTSQINTSIDAEIAIWDDNDVWIDFGMDKVRGFVSADEVAAWIDMCSKAEKIEDIQKKIN